MFKYPRPPKRIRLGAPQKPHGKRRMRLLSYQREWLKRADAAYLEHAAAAHHAKMRRIRERPATTLVEMMERHIDAAQESMMFSIECSLYYNVDMTQMPTEPPPDA